MYEQLKIVILHSNKKNFALFISIHNSLDNVFFLFLAHY